jgi:UDP-GlcNAc3NAcA epimerase
METLRGMGRALPCVLSVLGSRPEVIQAAPLSAAFAGRVDEVLVDTGQHYDWAMAEGQIADTNLPRPHYNLGVGSRTDAEQLALGAERIGAVIAEVSPQLVVVRGDTNATLAGARASTQAGIPIVHVEAGLRSFRADMPEERNRVETDRLAAVLCAPTEAARGNLEAEQVGGQVYVTGDPLFDILLSRRDSLQPSGEPEPFVLATIHRNYNTDDDERLQAALDCLGRIRTRVVFPIHPRTRKRLEGGGFASPANVELREPVTYLQMLALERDAEAIVTDSGGVQREAYAWRKRCVTLREETEWVETVDVGWNFLVGVDPDRVEEAFAQPLPEEHPPLFGDGRASDRIAGIVVDYLEREVGSGS